MAPSSAAMYGLLAGNQFSNYIVRHGLPSIVQVATKQLGLTDGQKAMLLAAHTPGYLLTQVPAGLLTERVGARRLLTLNTAGAALMLSLAPIAVRVGGGARALALCFSGMALFHGPFIPCQAELKRQWLPTGPARAWALRFISMGGKVASFSATLTPWLCARLGWQGTAWAYGCATLAFSVLWEIVAADRPGPRPAAAPSKVVGGTRRAPDWRIFRVPSSLVVVLMHVAFNNLLTVFSITVFTFFDEVLGCSLEQTGRWLAWPPL
jgi:MFS family permease